MNTPSWMLETGPRAANRGGWTRRNRGRRVTDRRTNLETILAIGVVLAWAWGVYELTLLFLR
jgi:hypothetical protein